MRSTVELPEKLLADAKRISGLRTNRAVIQAALEEYVRHLLIERLKARLGNCDLAITQEDLRRMRDED